jgi:hypothetical protein
VCGRLKIKSLQAQFQALLLEYRQSQKFECNPTVMMMRWECWTAMTAGYARLLVHTHTHKTTKTTNTTKTFSPHTHTHELITQRRLTQQTSLFTNQFQDDLNSRI